MKNKVILKPVMKNGSFCVEYLDGTRSDIYVREDMIRLAYENDQYITYDPENEIRRRAEKTKIETDITVVTPVEETMTEPDYSIWDTTSDINQSAYEWVCNKLGLTLI